MSRLLLSLIFILFYIPSLVAQPYTVSGKVSDSASGEVLPFVNIVINQGKSGGMTDIDGRFKLSSAEAIRTLSLSYVGYEPLSVEVKSNWLNLKLVKREIELPEVTIVAGENPAHRIIRQVVKHRKDNDPFYIPAYAFTSYDKMAFTLVADSLTRTDSLEESTVKLMNVIDNQHLFLMESVAIHHYRYPGHPHDSIIATRISGFKDPLFAFLISQLQSTSFYDETIDIAGNQYVNPVSRGTEKYYFFALRDTLSGEQAGDSTFVISYKPRPGKNFDGLRGLLYISNQGWAISNVIAEPARQDETLLVNIQQMYQRLENGQWFPVQLNTEITINNIDLGKARLVGMGKSYRQNIRLNEDTKRNWPSDVVTRVLPDAAYRTEEYWNQYRTDSLSRKDLNTYRIIDSLGQAHHFDRMGRGMSALSSGRLPIGMIELDLNRLFRYNKYEGIYLGIGMHTSDRFSQVFKTGGYLGYGFRDEKLKWGADMGVRLRKLAHSRIGLSYSDDLAETAQTEFLGDAKSALNSWEFRNFYIEMMDRVQSTRFTWSFIPIPHVDFHLGIEQAVKKALYPYGFQHTSTQNLVVLSQKHTFGKLVAGLRFAPGEKFISDQYDRIQARKPNPESWLQYTFSRKDFLNGDFTYHRMDFKTKYSINYRFFGKTTLWLRASWMDKAAPQSEMINGYGSAGSGFSLYAPGSFTTMMAGEFLNDRFVGIFITHSFGKILYQNPNFQPEPSVVFNFGIGGLERPDLHYLSLFKTMEKGYTEAGLLIDNILSSPLSGIGCGVFYKAGAYSNATISKNFMFRLTLNYKISN